MRKIKFLWKEFIKWISDVQKCKIMIVTYFPIENKIECVDWCSQKIKPFCGKFTPELWNEIKSYCRLQTEDRHRASTRIYIWAGMEKKHLAYSEPIENYLNNINLLQTGQGFHYGSGKRYGEAEKKKCPTCNRPI